MTAIQLNAEIYEALSVIAKDESLLKKAAKSLKRLAKQKKDESFMSKEDFFAMVDASLEEAQNGKIKSIKTEQELSTFLESL